MSDPVDSRAKQQQLRGCGGCFFAFLLLWILVLFLGGGSPSIKAGPASACVQRVHAIGSAMFSYANDHSSKYPDAKSSTEVFQKLLDGNYVTDPKIFYIPAPGKVSPVPGQRLKPENVCFDVTSGLTLDSPKELPVVFLSGYKVTYAPGKSAIPVNKPYPKLGGDYRDWDDWWNNVWPRGNVGPGIAVRRVDNSAYWINAVEEKNGDESIPNFISSDFTPDGKAYIQLTPEGQLP